MNPDIQTYIEKQDDNVRSICTTLASLIDQALSAAESKIWHAHPVWFIDKNPIVGFSLQKAGVRLMFWSGADFDEAQLNVRAGKFKDASIFYQHHDQIHQDDVIRWLDKSKHIQWDYKNIVKNKGKLERVK